MLKGKLPSEVVNERLQYINAQKQFVQEQKQKLQEIIEQLGISQESLAKVEPKQVCPYDANHHIPEKAFKQHVEKCRLLRAGCQRDELPSQLLNPDFCYEGRKSLKIEIDESLLNKIIWDSCAQNGEVYTGHRSMPVSQVDQAMNLTQSDRLAVYQHVVSESHAAGQVISVDRSDELLTTDWGSLVKKGLLDAQDNQKYASKLEQLAALRDLKRRRQSYRAKNVHITKKSYTEIIREVIVNQMEVLVPAVGAEDVKDTNNGDRKERSAGDRKRKDREEDGDSYRNRKRSRSRSRSRERRRRRDQAIEKEQDREKDRHSKSSARHRDSPSEYRSKSKTVELIKKEPGVGERVSERVGLTNQQEDSVQSVNEESTSTPVEAPARSRSNSTSLSSEEEDKHRQKHKKSKHSKKKSKHSKKHSKKHKR